MPEDDEEIKEIQEENDSIIETYINLEKLLDALNKNINTSFENIKKYMKIQRDILEKMNKDLRDYLDKKEEQSKVYIE